MANKINFNVGFNSDFSKVQNDLTSLKTQLNEIQSNGIRFNDSDLRVAASAAQQINTALREAYDTSLNNININKFNSSLTKSGTSIKQVADNLLLADRQGIATFKNLTKVLSNAEIPLKKTSKLLDDMWLTMKNTAKWSISSSVLNGFQGALQKSFYFAKDLNQSLNNIRIVTGKSKEEMDGFAETANKAAQTLRSSTLAYTDAALIYYQQGLGEQDVQARADVTIKAANVARTSGQQMSEYLTAIWNGYKVDAAEAELYVDKVSAVAAETAADLGELAQGFSRVAAAANVMGVDADQLNSYLATVISTTREAPETIGTAFKTIFARLNSITLGGEDDEGWGLSKVGKELDKIGVKIADQYGFLRDTGDVMQEIGGRWTTLSKEQQQATAVAMAGRQQYARLIALFDNWDQAQQTLEVSRNAAGALGDQARIYFESWEAASRQVSTSLENIYKDAINSNDFIELLNNTNSVINGIDTLIDGMGGFGNVLLALSSILANRFNKQLAKTYDGLVDNIGILTNKTYTKSSNIFVSSANDIDRLLKSNQRMSNSMRREYEDDKIILEMRSRLANQTSKLTDEQRNYANDQIKRIQHIQEEKRALDAHNDALAMQVRRQAQLAQSAIAQTRVNADASVPSVFGNTVEDANRSRTVYSNSLQIMEDITAQQYKREEAGRQVAIIEEQIANRLTENLVNGKEVLRTYRDTYAQFTQIDAALNEINGSTALTRQQAEEILRHYVQQERVISNILRGVDTEGDVQKQITNILEETVAARQRENNLIDENTPQLERQKKLIRDHLDGVVRLNEQKQKSQMLDQNAKIAAQEQSEILNKSTATIGQNLADITSVSLSLMSTITQLKNVIDQLYSEDATGAEKTISVATGLADMLFLILQVVPLLKQFKGATAAAGATTAVAGTATTGFATAMGGVGAAIAAALPIILAVVGAVAAIGIGIYAYNKHLENQRKAVIESNEALLEANRIYNEQADELKVLNGEYDTLYKNYKNTGELSADLATKAEELAERYNLEGAALARLTGNYDALTESIAKATVAEADRNLEKTQDSFQKISKAFVEDAKGLKVEEVYTKSKSSAGLYGDYSNVGFDELVGVGTRIQKKSFGAPQEITDVERNNLLKYFNESQLFFSDTEKGVVTILEDGIESRKANFDALLQIAEDSKSGIVDKSALPQQVIDQALEVYDNKEMYEQFAESLEAYANAAVESEITNYFSDDMDNSLSEFKRRKDQIVVGLDGIGLSAEEARAKVNNIFVADERVSSQNSLLEAANEKLKEIANVDTSTYFSFLDSLSEEEQKRFLNTDFALVDWNSIKQQFGAKFNGAIADGIVENKNIVQNALSTLASGQILDSKVYSDLENIYEEFEDLSLNSLSRQQEILTNYIMSSQTAFYEATDLEIQKLLEELDLLTQKADILDFDYLLEQSNKLSQEISSLTNELQSSMLTEPQKIEIESSLGEKQQRLVHVQTLLELPDNITEVSKTIDEKLEIKRERAIKVTLDGADVIISQSELLGQAAEKIGEGYRISKGDIDFFAQAFPQLLENIEIATDGAMQLDQHLVDSFFESTKEKIRIDKEGLIAQLEHQRVVYELERDQAQQRLELAKQLAEGNITYSEYQYTLKGILEAQTTAKTELEAQKQADANVESAHASEVASELSTQEILTNLGDIGNSSVESYALAAKAAINSTQNQISGWNKVAQAAAQAANAVKGVAEGYVIDYEEITGPTLKPFAQTGAGSDTQKKSTIRSLEELTERIEGLTNGSGGRPADSTLANELERVQAEYVAQSKLFGQEQIGIETARRDSAVQTIGLIDTSIAKLKAGFDSISRYATGDTGGSGSDKKEQQRLEEILERYHEINEQLEYQEKIITNLERKKDSLYGQNYLDALDEQIKANAQIITLEKEKMDIAKAFMEIDKVNAANLGATFSEEGIITNYTDLLRKKQEEINRMITTGISDEALEKEKEAFEFLQAVLDTYEESFSTYHEQFNKVFETQLEMQSLAMEKITKEIEFKIIVSEDTIKLLDYFRGGYNKFDEMSESLGLLSQKYAETAKQAEIFYQAIQQLDVSLAAGEITEAEYNDSLADMKDKLLGALEALRAIETEMRTSYSEALNKGLAEIKQYTAQVDFMQSSLTHFSNLLGLMGQGENFDAFDKIYRSQVSVSKNQIEIQKKTIEGLKAEQNAMRRAGEEGSEGWFALVNAISQAEEQLYSLTAQTLKSIEDLYKNTISNILTSLEETLSGGRLDELTSSYDRYRDEQDRFLTKTNQLYEINKLQGQIQSEIDKTDNPIRKQKLKDLDKYVQELGEQNKLSKYELEYAQAKYDLAMKEMALEEARNAKTDLRLTRDSQGNWTYQYTADQDMIDSAQQEYEDALNNLYNKSLERVEELENEIIQINKEMQEALAGIERDNYATAEEYQAALLEVRQFYQQKLYDVYSQYNIARQNLEKDTYDITLALTNDAILAAERQKEGYNQNIADMIDRLMGEGEDSFTNATDSAIEQMVDAWQEWKDKVQEVGEDVGLTEDDIMDKTDDLTQSSQDLKDVIVGEVIPAIMDEINAVRLEISAYEELRRSLQETIRMYEELLRAKLNADSAGGGNKPSGGGSSGSSGGSSNKPSNGGGGSSSSSGGGGKKVGDTVSSVPGTWYYDSYGTKPQGSTSQGGANQQWTITQYVPGRKYPYHVQGDGWGSGWVSSFKTGGYTGAWGNEGKLSVLHEKEMVLNKSDTSNILQAVDLIRDLAPLFSIIEQDLALNANSFRAGIGALASRGGNNGTVSATGQSQQVVIQASFPSVTSRQEIEAAFNNMANEASQYAKRNK